MESTCPDNRLSYMVEGVIVAGASIKYEAVEGGDPGWVIHLIDPKHPQAPLAQFRVREADLGDNDKRLALKKRIDYHWTMAFMD